MISVIIPIYNAQNYIERCLYSIISQEYTDLEIIVIDDGSTDDSLKICKEIQIIDSRIQVYEHMNHGPVYTRKRGLDLSKGDYITFVDADDYIEPQMYTRLFAEISEGFDFVHSAYYSGIDNQVIGSIDKTEFFTSTESQEYFISKYILDFASAECIAPSMWSKIYRRDFIVRCFNKIPDDIKFGEDLLLLCICIFECKSIKCLDEAFYHYTDNPESITHAIGIDKISQIVRLSDALRTVFENYGVNEKMYECEDAYINWILTSYIIKMTRFVVNRYRLLNVYECFGKNVVIYGAGQVGRDVYSQLSKYNNINIIDWVDRNSNIIIDYYSINHPNELLSRKFDLIIVAIKDRKISKKIFDELIANGIDENKIIINQIGIWT